jgi:BTB/POZ domain
MVLVKVGAKEVTFQLHKSILCDISTFFTAAFTGQFLEATENIVKMPEEDVEVFNLFVNWLYGCYHTPDIKDNETSSINSVMQELLKLCTFGDKNWSCQVAGKHDQETVLSTQADRY